MTRIGLIARADDTGLGQQSREFHRHLDPAKTLIVDLTEQSASGKDLTIHPDRFPGEGTSIVRGIPTDADLELWLDGLDTVFTMETPYNYRLYSLARQRGIKTVLQANWELLDYLQDGPHQQHLPDVLALPSTWFLPMARHRFSGQMKVTYLPVPIPTDRWNESLTDTDICRRFLHVAGHPALADRNGTANLLDALRYVRQPVTVTLTCQRPGYLGSLIKPGQDHGNATLVIDSAPRQHYWDLYTGQDAMVLPRRYGGLCLPLNEALGAGMPVIMPDISPNNRWLPPDWLVPAHAENTVLTKTLIDIYYTDPQALAARMDQMAADPDLYARSRQQARFLAQEYSWTALFTYYQEVLSP